MHRIDGRIERQHLAAPGQDVFEFGERHSRFNADRKIARLVLEHSGHRGGGNGGLGRLGRSAVPVLREVTAQTDGSPLQGESTQTFRELLRSLRPLSFEGKTFQGSFYL